MNYTFSNKISTLKASAIREILKHTSNPEIVPFAAGNPAPESFPIKQMQEISEKIYKANAVSAFQYGITEGYTPLREVTANRLCDKYNIDKAQNQTIIVSGGQQGIDLSCKVLCNEGDTIICENPSFIGALNAFRSYNVNLCGVEIEPDGINIEKLEHALKTQKNVKMLYLIPTFQNPSGITMSLTKRQAVYKLAQEYNVIILEDNPYGELRFSGNELPTIKSFDTDGRVIYCGSYSKVLSAGIRVGFVSASSEIISKIVVAKQVSDVHTNSFFQMLAYDFLTNYNYEAHIENIKNIYKRKSQLMVDVLEKDLNKNVSFIKPEGGLFLWCTAPKGTDILKLAGAALEKKIAIVPGFAFMANESDECSSFRLNYSTPSDEQITEGTKTLCCVIDNFLK